MIKRYDSYKNSGVEWIGEIPSQWEIRRVKYLPKLGKSSFIDGDWIESSYISESGIRYITTGNIGEGYYKEQGKGFITEETFKELNCTEVFPGDLIISRLSLPIGRSCIIPELGFRIVTSVDNVILRPKDGINKFFLNYYFNSKKYFEWTELISRGTTLTRISRTMLGSNPVIIPIETEQKQIVSFLDTKTTLIDTLIEKTQRKIELLKEQRTSLINHTVTKGLNPNVEMKDSGVEWIGEIPKIWKITKIKHHSKVNVGLVINPSTYFDDFGTVPIITGKNVTTEGIDISKVDHITQTSNDFLEQTQIYYGDIVSMRVGYPGRSCVVKLEENGYNCCSLIITRKSKTFNSKLLNYILNSNIGKHQVQLCQGGMGQQVVNLSDWREFIIPTPNLPEQQQIVEFLDNKTTVIDTTISTEQNRIELLKEYRQSLISNVVTGKIKVTNDE